MASFSTVADMKKLIEKTYQSRRKPLPPQLAWRPDDLRDDTLASWLSFLRAGIRTKSTLAVGATGTAPSGHHRRHHRMSGAKPWCMTSRSETRLPRSDVTAGRW
jgi:hypothetical protein